MKNPERTEREPLECPTALRQVAFQLVRFLPIQDKRRTRIVIHAFSETRDTNQTPLSEGSGNDPLVGLEGKSVRDPVAGINGVKLSAFELLDQVPQGTVVRAAQMLPVEVRKQESPRARENGQPEQAHRDGPAHPGCREEAPDGQPEHDREDGIERKQEAGLGQIGEPVRADDDGPDSERQQQEKKGPRAGGVLPDRCLPNDRSPAPDLESRDEHGHGGQDERNGKLSGIGLGVIQDRTRTQKNWGCLRRDGREVRAELGKIGGLQREGVKALPVISKIAQPPR